MSSQSPGRSSLPSPTTRRAPEKRRLLVSSCQVACFRLAKSIDLRGGAKWPGHFHSPLIPPPPPLPSPFKSIILAASQYRFQTLSEFRSCKAGLPPCTPREGVCMNAVRFHLPRSICPVKSRPAGETSTNNAWLGLQTGHRCMDIERLGST